jgi:hypothetical protein
MSYKCQLCPTHTVATYIFVHSCHTYPNHFESPNHRILYKRALLKKTQESVFYKNNNCHEAHTKTVILSLNYGV